MAFNGEPTKEEDDEDNGEGGEEVESAASASKMSELARFHASWFSRGDSAVRRVKDRLCGGDSWRLEVRAPWRVAEGGTPAAAAVVAAVASAAAAVSFRHSAVTSTGRRCLALKRRAIRVEVVPSSAGKSRSEENIRRGTRETH